MPDPSAAPGRSPAAVFGELAEVVGGLRAALRRAHALIGERYRDAPGRYEAVFAPVPHCFDVPMQERAFGWLARELVSRPPSTAR
ncbi:hypothetical protein [Nonomuraea sp. NPDC052265]|uniref:hypothetical protein n=1 Tax=Nonomuraea sp. NPDC052265 TaxID=3364374 RepID=UPI0037C9554D